MSYLPPPFEGVPRRRTGSRSLSWWAAVALVILGLATTGAPVLAQTAVHVQRLGLAEGLSEEYAQAFAQDSAGFVWVGTQAGVNRFDGYRFTTYRHDPTDSTSVVSDWVVALAADTEGGMWMGTLSGVSHFDPRTQRFRSYHPNPNDPHTLSGGMVRSMTVARDGMVWIGVGFRVNRLDPTTGLVARFGLSPNGRRPFSAVNALVEDTDGSIWAATGQGLFRWRSDEEGFQVVPVCQNPRPRVGGLARDVRNRLWVSCIGEGLYVAESERDGFRRADTVGADAGLFDQASYLTPDGSWGLWFCSARGLARLDGRTGRIEMYKDADDALGLPSVQTRILFGDRDGTLWAGAATGGVTRITASARAFHLARLSQNDPNSLPDDLVWRMAEGPDGRVWIGTDAGLAVLDPRTDRIERRPVRGTQVRNRNRIHTVRKGPDGQMWVGSSGGLGYVDPATDQYFAYDWQGNPPFRNSEVYDITYDADGRLWVAFRGVGVVRLDPDGRWVHFPPNAQDPNTAAINSQITTLYKDPQGTIWAAAFRGLIRLHPDESRFEKYPGLGAEDLVTDMYRTSDGVLWLATAFGLRRIEAGQDSATAPDSIPGVTGNQIYTILADDQERLWLGTMHGLLRYDPATGDVRAYNVSDGLQGDEFNGGVALRASDGRMYFGGVHGVTMFYPDELKPAPPPRVVLTELRVLNEPVPVGGSLLPAPLPYVDQIVLHHTQPMFSIGFTALDYEAPDRVTFEYRLDGVHRGWVRASSSERRATFTNPPPGRHTLHVRARNADGVWSENEATLQVRVYPAPWLSWWAYTIYTMLIVGAVITAFVIQRRRLIREREVNRQLRELDRMKDDFLASTSHELRTPLHGIIGLAESLIEGAGGPLAPKVSGNLRVIAQSGRRLAAMVNQVLDFAKLRQSELQLQHVAVDLEPLFDIVTTLTRPLAEAKDVELRLEVAPDLPEVAGDETRLEQILLNLIGNAIKFTDDGHVIVRALSEGDEVLVEVEDTGPGIPEERLEQIFEAFYQVESAESRAHAGTGLGLAVTRELVEMHGGAITVQSTVGKGSTFTVRLRRWAAEQPSPEVEAPVARPKSDTLVELVDAGVGPSSSEVEQVDQRGAGVSILVVDDDPVNREVLQNLLGMHAYDITSVSGGEEALAAVETHQFDLVLLDVMMPHMSGFEVCRIMRDREDLHDLPVVFLTAKNQMSDLVHGLELGANDYLTKPVARGELLARIDTQLRLLSMRRDLDRLLSERTDELRVITELLPICGHCHAIRNDSGYWERLETFVSEHTRMSFSHGICPDCLVEQYGELGEDVLKEIGKP